MSRSRSLLAALVAVVALIGGCTPGEPEFSDEDRARAVDRGDDEDAENDEDGDAAEPEATLEVVGVDIDFDEESYSAPAGLLAIEFINEGAILHNVVVEELGDELVVEADGGETDTGTVSLDPGAYTIYCSVPGHRAAGMEAELTAE